MEVDNDLARDIIKLVKNYIYKNNQYIKFFDSIEDMREELILSVLKCFSGFNILRGKLSTFIFMVCKTACLKKIRQQLSKKRLLKTVSLSEPIPGSENTCVEDILSTDNNYELDAEERILLSTIKQMLGREAWLYYIDGLTVLEIARQVGITRTGVQKRIEKNLSDILNKIEGKYKENKRPKYAAKILAEHLNCSVRTAYRKLAKSKQNLNLEEKVC